MNDGVAMGNGSSGEHSTVCESKRLKDFVERSMSAIGTSECDAAYMAHQLITSELAGHPSHGLRRLTEYVDRALRGIADPAACVSVEKDTGTLLALNGNRAFGHFALRDAMIMAIERAKIHGISAVTIRNSDFAGRFAPFCELAAETGTVSLIFGNNNGAAQSVLPPGGVQPRLSTNPIAAGVPRAKAPHMIIDFATSSVASGRLDQEKDSGSRVPQEWVGPGDHLKLFGGHKGFGLSLLVEALGGALSGAGTVSSREAEEAQGTMIIAIDVAQLRDLDEYTAQVEEFIAHVKSTKLEPGARPIRAPGENSLTETELLAHRTISVSESTWDKLKHVARTLGLRLPETG